MRTSKKEDWNRPPQKPEAFISNRAPSSRLQVRRKKATLHSKAGEKALWKHHGILLTSAQQLNIDRCIITTIVSTIVVLTMAAASLC